MDVRFAIVAAPGPYLTAPRHPYSRDVLYVVTYGVIPATCRTRYHMRTHAIGFHPGMATPQSPVVIGDGVSIGVDAQLIIETLVP